MMKLLLPILALVLSFAWHAPLDAAPPAGPGTETQAENTHWITHSSGVRHNASCRYYRNSKGRPCGKDEGRACKICGG